MKQRGPTPCSEPDADSSPRLKIFESRSKAIYWGQEVKDGVGLVATGFPVVFLAGPRALASVLALFQLFQPLDGFSGIAGDAGRDPKVDAEFVEPVGELF